MQHSYYNIHYKFVHAFFDGKLRTKIYPKSFFRPKRRFAESLPGRGQDWESWTQQVWHKSSLVQHRRSSFLSDVRSYLLHLRKYFSGACGKGETGLITKQFRLLLTHTYLHYRLRLVSCMYIGYAIFLSNLKCSKN
jgi:hypothetical protein